MAEFLVKAKDAVHPDPIKDARGSYKRGDIVVIMPDGHQWGALEGLPDFVVVKIVGLDHERVQQFIESESELDNGKQVTTRRRRWNIRWNDLPLGVRNSLRDTGEVSVTWAQVRNFVQNKTTLVIADEVL